MSQQQKLNSILLAALAAGVLSPNALTVGGLQITVGGGELTAGSGSSSDDGGSTPPVVANPTAWYTVAHTGDSFTFAQPTLCRYGYPGHYTQLTLNGAVTVNDATVGANPALYGPSELQAQDPAFASLKTKIMCIGDSITGFYLDELVAQMAAGAAGFSNFDFVGNNGSPPKDSNGYGGYVFRDLLAASGTGTKFANSGNAYYGDARDLDNWMAGQAPDIVLFHGFTNDGADAPGCLQALDLILAKVRATNPAVRFIAAQIIPQQQNPTWSTTINPQIVSWAAANTTSQSPVTTVDQYTGFDPSVYDASTNPTGMSRDGTHPTSIYAPGVGATQPEYLTGAYHMSRVWVAALRAAVVGTPAPVQTRSLIGTAPIGINVSDMSANYSRRCAYVNTVRASAAFEVTAGGSAPPLDANGWPTTDFRFQTLWLDKYSGASRSVTASFTGWADGITASLTTRFAVSNKTYDAGSNTTSFTFTDNGGGHYGALLTFTGTRLAGGSTGPLNTGITNLVIPAFGYAVADAATKVWTDEEVNFLKKFTTGRFMDTQPYGANGDVASTDFHSGRSSPMGQSFAELVLLANTAAVNPWFCIGASWNDQAVIDFATYMDAHLASNLSMYVEFSNETWNSGFQQFWWTLTQAALEVKGFYGGGGYDRWLNYSVAGNVCTLHTGQPHGWTNGQTVWVQGVANTYGPVTVTSVADDSHATFACNYQDTAEANYGGGTCVVGDISGNLCTGGETNIYAIGSRWRMRRLKQISDLIRGVVGDSKMQSRFRIVWADQMVNNDSRGELDYLANTFTARPVSDYLYGVAGAPYYSATTTATDVNATLAEVVADLTAQATAAKVNYKFDARIIAASGYGLKSLWYEAGPDTSKIGDNYPANQIRLQAQLDPGAKVAAEQMLRDWFQLGGDTACWYNDGVVNPADGDQSQWSCWGITDSATNFAAPKISAFIELQASGVPATRNVLTPTVGAVSVVSPAAGEEQYTGAPAAWTAYSSRRFNINVPANGGGIYALTIDYSASAALTFLVSGLGTGGVAQIVGAPDMVSTRTTDAMALTLREGPNAIVLSVAEGSAGRVFPRALNFTCTALESGAQLTVGGAAITAGGQPLSA